jgi:hypothetical protein
MMAKRKNWAALSILLAAFFFSSCSMFHSRPVKPMAYAEAANQAALLAGADTNPESAPVYQLARDQLARARSYYRLKNFKEARNLAGKSRRLLEEAEWRALRSSGGASEAESLVK